MVRKKTIMLLTRPIFKKNPALLPKPDERELGSLTAIYKVIKETSSNALLHIEINHKKVTKMLTSQLKKLEDQGFLLTKYPDQLQALVAELRCKKQDTSFLYKPLTEKDPLEDELISLLNNHTDRENEIEAIFETRPGTTISGAKLSKLTQATAYKIIRSLKLKQYMKRRQTQANVASTILDVKQTFNIKLTEENLWNGLRNNDLSRTTKVFLWMTMHDAYMVGTNWLRTSYSPEYQERGECQVCHTTETMDVILTKCLSNGQAEIWKNVRKLWSQKEKKDLTITLGTILVSPSTVIKENGQNKRGAT